ncbi:MAG: hypothetical protein KatS3mg119_0344 [Rhodothalassiaceae bacterium]|nr:MAG: hypothetical protein KatS3mg119_0344 [Rhodothalassiaceae bacterium]
MDIRLWHGRTIGGDHLSAPQKAVLDAWLAARGAAAFPARPGIDLRAIKAALGAIAILDVLREADGRARGFATRLWGTRLVEWTGAEITGRIIDRASGPRGVLQRLSRVVETAEPLLAPRVLVPWSPYEYKRFSVLALPLGVRPPVVDQVLCVFEPVDASA